MDVLSKDAKQIIANAERPASIALIYAAALTMGKCENEEQIAQVEETDNEDESDGDDDDNTF